MPCSPSVTTIPPATPNVLSRGIVGDIGGEIVVASPIYKQQLQSHHGTVSRRAAIRGPAYMAEVRSGRIWVRRSRAAASSRAQARLVVIAMAWPPCARSRSLRGLAPQGYDITVFAPNPMAATIASCFRPVVRRKAHRGHRHSPPEWYVEHGITLHREDPWPASIACAAACDPATASRHPSTGC